MNNEIDLIFPKAKYAISNYYANDVDNYAVQNFVVIFGTEKSAKMIYQRLKPYFNSSPVNSIQKIGKAISFYSYSTNTVSSQCFNEIKTKTISNLNNIF